MSHRSPPFLVESDLLPVAPPRAAPLRAAAPGQPTPPSRHGHQSQTASASTQPNRTSTSGSEASDHRRHPAADIGTRRDYLEPCRRWPLPRRRAGATDNEPDELPSCAPCDRDLYNDERPHTPLGGRSPAEAHRGLSAFRRIESFPQPRRRRLRRDQPGVHLSPALKLSKRPEPPQIAKSDQHLDDERVGRNAVGKHEVHPSLPDRKRRTSSSV